MASDKDYLDYVLELLSELKGITYKKMMGEYILYKNGVIFGGVYDNRFLIKKTRLSSKLGLKEVIPYPTSKGMYLMDSEDPDEIKNFVLKVYRDETKNWTRYDLEDWTDKEVKKLADKGNESCMFEYGMRLYAREKHEEAFKYLYPLVYLDNFYIWERVISIAYSYVPGLMSDEELFKLTLRRHEHSSSYYSYILAHMYRDGKGCEQDLTKYVELLKICSNDGSMYATYELAECYEKGFGVPQSYEEAFKVYYYWLDDHGKRDYWCEYKVAYYMYHELGGQKKDPDSMKYHLEYAGRVVPEAREMYKELYGKELKI